MLKISSLDLFLSHGSEIGFFLEPTHFTSAFLSSGYEQQPTLTLLSIVLLFNVYVEGTSEFQEADYFDYAVENYSRLAFSGSHPKVVLYTIQANVLLCYYLLLKGRALDGKVHLRRLLDMSPEEARSYSLSCNNLNALLARFNSELRSPESAKALPVQRRLLVIHLLSKVASIQLHYAFVSANANSQAQVLSIARSILEMLKGLDLKAFMLIDPIVAVCASLRIVEAQD
ncbi:hypothetical protein VNI00_009353 [Paramarasmius palmivorus]|uniref:Uncharacterized protein n=1 Tax=Paramarasmius palmivorus TaxID=297713 RepID=A0AAW0CR27_9AGAR